MSPAVLDQKVQKVRNSVGAKRIGVSEFARSRQWRRELAQEGCIAVVERNEPIGYMLAPDYVEALLERIDDAERELELDYIRNLAECRKDSVYLSGEELRDAALAYADEHADEIREAFHASE